MKYLGHIVSEEGIQTDPSKIECLKKWPPPKNIKEVRRFIGFAGFYRRFIRNFSKIAKPIHELLRGDIPCKKRSAGYSKKFSSPIQWKEIHQSAFDKLIQLLCEAPILSFADSVDHFCSILMHVVKVLVLFYTKLRKMVKPIPFLMPAGVFVHQRQITQLTNLNSLL